MERKLKRRDFLKLSAIGAVGAVAAACGPAVQPTPIIQEKIVEVTKEVVTEKQVQVTVEVPTKRAEPPMLVEKVKAGTLPPVDERLPETPFVLSGREAIGVYGGEIRMPHFDPVWMTSNYDITGDRWLHYSDFDTKTIVPNVLESYESSADGKEWTFKIRKGMKWSDGTPLTTEDVRFWWEDVSIDPDVAGGVQWQFRFGGERMKVDIIDDFTFKFTFKATFGNFAAHMTRWHQFWNIILPAHYLKQFHKKYVDEAKLVEMAKALKLETWTQLFWNKDQWGANIWQGAENWKEVPTLGAWNIVDRPQEGLYLWERNPYYWKVDLAGNQLPYIDTMRYDFKQNTEATKLSIAQGELDVVSQHDVSIADYPFYKENEEKGHFVVGDYISCMTDRYVFFPQHYLADDPEMTKIINHPNFVKALSVAFDREEINNSLYYGQARMGQLSPMPQSKYFKQKYTTAWAQYDPALGNQLLDEMGLDQRDADGFRLRSDGQRLTFLIEHAGDRVGVVTNKFVEMAVTFWRELGIDASAKVIQESLYNERMLNHQVQCGVWHADRCTDMLLHIEPQWYFPTGDPNQGTACSAWAQWFQAEDKTVAGLIEPPAEILKLYDIFAQMTSTMDENERVTLGQQIFDWLADNPLEIGSIVECPAPLLFNKNLRNLPRPKSVIGWDSFGLNTYHPAGFFYEGGVRG